MNDNNLSFVYHEMHVTKLDFEELMVKMKFDHYFDQPFEVDIEGIIAEFRIHGDYDFEEPPKKKQKIMSGHTI